MKIDKPTCDWVAMGEGVGGCRDGANRFADLLEVIVPSGGAIVVLRYVYMDESGTHAGSSVMSMAGYVFTKEQATRFSRDWEKDLKRFGLPFAHMTDCATGNGHYADMTMDARIESEKALIAATRHRSLFGVAIAVDKSRYDEVFGLGRYDHDGYTFCLGLCVTGVLRWAERNFYNGRFAFVFESGHAAAAEADRIMQALPKQRNGHYYSSHTFVRKQDAPPLQAADMLAWQYAHFVKRRGDGIVQKRKDFKALLQPRDELREFDRELVNHWRDLMNDLDEKILAKLPTHMPSITEFERLK